MAVLKKVDAPFTQVPNELIETLEADVLGYYIKMLKKPAEWRFSHAALIEDLKVGAVKLKQIVRALKNAGVLSITAITGDDGKVQEWHWTVSAMPIQMPENQAGGNGSHKYQNHTSGLTANHGSQMPENKAVNENQKYENHTTGKTRGMQNQLVANHTTYKERILRNKESLTNKKRKSRISENLQLSDQHREALAKINPHKSAEPLFEAFKDHWLASARPDAMKADWMAAWRMWCRKDVEFNGLTNSQTNQNKEFNHARGYTASNGAGNTARGTAGANGTRTSGINQHLNGANTGNDPLFARIAAISRITKNE